MNAADHVYNKTSQNKYLLSGVVMMHECPKMTANDVAREGLLMPIVLIGLQEHTTSLIMDIITHKCE